MDMDKAPLNRAHQLERRADALSRQKKMDESIQCHLEAVELYKKCLQLGDNKQALESIQLQKEWNERQVRLLQLKKSYLERTEKEKKFRKITSSKNLTKETVDNLEAKIFRNFETHDSLICYLAQRGIINSQDKHCHSTIEEVEEKDESPFVVGNKLPKNDSIVIEELKELSEQLRESVQGLLNQLSDRQIRIKQIIEQVKNLDVEKSSKEELLIQLDDRNKEIGQLKNYIKDLELEKSDKDEIANNNLKITESSETSLSATELDLDITELNSFPHLEFKPISVPEIDISAFKQFRLPEVNRKLMGKSE